jgi:hypothetical protein
LGGKKKLFPFVTNFFSFSDFARREREREREGKNGRRKKNGGTKKGKSCLRKKTSPTFLVLEKKVV